MALAAGVGSAMAVAAGVTLGSVCSVPGKMYSRTGNHQRSASPEQDNYYREVEERREPPMSARGRQCASIRPAPAGPSPEWEEDDMCALSIGFSMEEARAHADAGQVKAMQRTPAEILAELQRGNARFWMNKAHRPETSAFQRRALISKQFPSVAILSCSDSRVPVEILFDQGLGDIFVIRVAGNCLDLAAQASLQYAVNHLKVKVVMVMGHEACGAVKASLQEDAALEKEPKALELALKGIKAGLDAKSLNMVKDVRAKDREAVTQNVRRQVEKLTQDSGMMGKVLQKELILIGSFYELSSGIVDFFYEATEAVAAKTPKA